MIMIAVLLAEIVLLGGVQFELNFEIQKCIETRLKNQNLRVILSSTNFYQACEVNYNYSPILYSLLHWFIDVFIIFSGRKKIGVERIGNVGSIYKVKI